MKIEVTVTNDEEKFSVGSWATKDPKYVLYALTSQLKAAAVLWPEELAQWSLSKSAGEPEQEQSHEAKQ